MQFPKWRRPRNITRTILMSIAIVFAILAGFSVLAWLLPSTFIGLGNAIVRITGNPDIQTNVDRLKNDPIPYAIFLGLTALVVRWFATKF